MHLPCPLPLARDPAQEGEDEGAVAYPFPKQVLAKLGGSGGAVDGHQRWGLTFSTIPLPTCLAHNVLLSLSLFIYIDIPPSEKIIRSAIATSHFAGSQGTLSNGQRSYFLEVREVDLPVAQFRDLSAKTLQRWGAHLQ